MANLDDRFISINYTKLIEFASHQEFAQTPSMVRLMDSKGFHLYESANTMVNSAPSRFAHTNNVDSVIQYRRQEEKTDADPSFECTFSDIMDARASMLLDVASDTGKDILVKYSGGIDSTAALVALLKNHEYPRKIGVVTTTQAILEHIMFFRDIVRHLDIISFEEYNHNPRVADEHICVDGQSADMIVFGRNDIPWDIANLEYDSNREISKIPQTDFVQGLIDECPSKLTTIFQHYWWLRCNHRTVSPVTHLQSMALHQKFAALKKIPCPGYHASNVSFYDHENFANYALSNFDSFMVNLNEQNHKQVSKDYISNYFGKPYIKFKADSGLSIIESLNLAHVFAVDKDMRFYHRYDTDLIEQIVTRHLEN